MSVSIWKNDPGSGQGLITLPEPNLKATELQFRFDQPAPLPKPGETPDAGSQDFRYWHAATWLRIGADFWAKHIPNASWQPGSSLPVILDAGEDLNAYYDRRALNFFHGPSGEGEGKLVYSGASVDILCHEMGHAILDSIKPELWNVASAEAAAFHESFGDMSAILCGLQVKQVREDIIGETRGNLYRSSWLSRVAEQMGEAIRAQYPDAVERDCLRNAVNAFTYRNPVSLPQSGPASQLSAEPHSFSRVFTGAFFEALGAMLSHKAGQDALPTEQLLQEVTDEMAAILVAGVQHASVVSNFYAQVAASMVFASAEVDPAYPALLRGAFVRRSILSLQSAVSVAPLVSSARALASLAPMPADAERLDVVAVPAAHYGLAQPLLVETASAPRRFAAASAAPDASPVEPPGSETSARSFLDDLFRQGRVDYNGFGEAHAKLAHSHRRLRTHLLVAEGETVRLQRRLFDCGLNHC